MSLPLKVQLGIRDHWAAENGSLQVSLKKLEGVLGQKVVVDPEWQLLLNELGEFYPDRLNFVQVIAGCIETFAKSATELLEDEEAHEEWIETLLDKTRSQLRLLVETSSPGSALVSWSEQRLGFVIHLPKRKIMLPSELFPGFRGGLLEAFSGKPTQALGQAAAADDWADVQMDSATGKPAVAEKTPTTVPQLGAGSGAPAEYLPNWESLPRPDELLLRPPYHLLLHASSRHIEIECSHSPSLKLLSDYLKRWCRVNHNDTRAPPAVEIKLQQSAFGLSEMFDRLELSTQENRYVAQFQVTAPIILALIEGVLGYKLLSHQGGTWTFRRETEFRTR